MPPSADRLLEFVTVVREGSISRAARVLQLPRATLSRRINGLERELGVRLLLRKTQPLRLTGAGEELFSRAGRLVVQTREMWQAVAQHNGALQGRLRVSIPPSVPVIHAYLVDFARRHPQVRLVVSTEARHVDLQAEGIDVAVRAGSVLRGSLVVRQIWRCPVWAMATPGYLEQRGKPASLADLGGHTCLIGFGGDGAPQGRWPLAGGGSLSVQGAMVCGDMALLQRAVVSGLGIGCLPEDLIAPALAEGRVERVLPELLRGEAVAHAVHEDREYVLPQVRAFIDGLVEHMGAMGTG